MAHTKSTRKRIRQDQKRHLRNQSVKTRIKGLTKKFRATVDGSEGDYSPPDGFAKDRSSFQGRAHQPLHPRPGRFVVLNRRTRPAPLPEDPLSAANGVRHGPGFP
jgi:hypothetical protein